MDEFYKLLSDELDKVLSGPGVTWDKKGIINAFNKAFTKAVIQYARSKGIDLV